VINLSIWGIVVLCFTIFGLIIVVRDKVITNNFIAISSLLILVLQTVFIFNDGFSMFPYNDKIFLIGIVVIVVTIFIGKHLLIKKKNYKAVLATLTLISLTVIYIEFFNGIYSFQDKNIFMETNMKLKKYYKIFPYKLVSSKNASGDVDRQAIGYIFSGLDLLATPIGKDKEGNIYYYKPHGFGEPGYWFRFGIPEGQQIAIGVIHEVRDF
jgi:hypothetical protein